MLDTVTALPRSRASVRQAWIDRLQRFAAAQLSVAAFCRAEGISSQAFYYWKSKLMPQAEQAASEHPRLLPVRLLNPPAPVEVVLPSGTVLRLNSGCDLALVRSLVDALGGAPC
jgi:transposase